MTSLAYKWFFYLASLLVFFNSSSFIMIWMSMELNLLSFLFLISGIHSKSDKTSMMFYYFLIQSLGSVMFLYGAVNNSPLNWLSDSLVTLSVTLKLGIYPLCFWIMNLGGSLSSKVLVSILTFQKVFMLIFFFNLGGYSMELIVLLSLFFGSMNIFFCSGMHMILIMSSISSTLWVYIFYLNSLSIYFFYFFIYTALAWSLTRSLVGSPNFNYILFFSFVGGLPPAALFFLKYGSFNILSLSYNWEICLILSIFTFFSFCGYLNYFYSNFFFSNFLYLNNKVWFSNMSKIFYGVLFSVFFIL